MNNASQQPGGISIYEQFELARKAQVEYLGKDKPVNAMTPLVSVWVTTYNHVNFIQDCLEGILNQLVDFDYEILIGDDESSDGTAELCRHYAEQYPDKIRLFERNRKTTSYGEGENKVYLNGKLLFTECRGKYIALCEGDDYWTDKKKLQLQVEFLEGHPEYGLSAHRYAILKEKGKGLEPDYCHALFAADMPGLEITVQNYFRDWLTKTMTVMFRRELLDVEELLQYDLSRDYHLFYQIIRRRKGYCLNRNMAVYRQHSGGIWSSLSNGADRVFIQLRMLSSLRRFHDHVSLKKAYIRCIRLYASNLGAYGRFSANPLMDRSYYRHLRRYVRYSNTPYYVMFIAPLTFIRWIWGVNRAGNVSGT